MDNPLMEHIETSDCTIENVLAIYIAIACDCPQGHLNDPIRFFSY